MDVRNTVLGCAISIGLFGCDIEPEDAAGQGLSASAGEASTGSSSPSDTTGGVGSTSSGSSSDDTSADDPTLDPSTTGTPEPDPEPGTTGDWDEGSSSGGWWGSSGSSGSDSGFFDTCTQHLDAAGCNTEFGCAWIGAEGRGVCIEDFGGGAADLCGFLDAELCDVLDDCAWDAEAEICALQ